MALKQWPPERGADMRDVCNFLYDRITQLEERLLLVSPPESALAKYPALAEAYKEYKTIERLTLGNE
jgi:hypothetical protein